MNSDDIKQIESVSLLSEVQQIKDLILNNPDYLMGLSKQELIALVFKIKSLGSKRFTDYEPHPKQRLFHLSESKTRLMLGGNRSGKTLGLFTETHWHLLDDYPKWYPEKLRIVPPIYWRWIATDYKQGVGGVFQHYFDELIPKSLIRRVTKTQQGVLTKIFYVNGSIMELMTNEQDVELFEGVPLHGLSIDEPCSRDRWVASMRGLIDYGGRCAFALTPLSEPWIYDEIYNKADGVEIFQVTVDMRDNEQNLPPGEIERFESTLTEEEKEARIHGKFTHLTGLIYKNFDRAVHVVKPYEIPADWKIINGLDPHDRKPHAVGWYAVDPMDNLICIGELEIQGTVHELAEAIKTWEKMNLIVKRSHYRVIDPNKGKAPAKMGQKGDLIMELNKEGLGYHGYVNDDILEGHLAVSKYLWYDKKKPLEVGNRPKLYFFDTCTKHIHGLTHYIWSDHKNKTEKSLKEKPRDIHKDYPDLIRYVVMSKPKYRKTIIPKREFNPNNITGY